MKQEELQTILGLHKKWLYSEDGGKQANLRDADLRGANLCGANLRGANLCDANMRDADLRGADLRDADLCDADLRDANLCDANLRGADLYGANLRGADLYGADLRGADLCDANMRGVNLCGADLYGADLRGAKNISKLLEAQTSIVPEAGSFVGWKKAHGKIVKLKILEDAKRSNATRRKCRCSKANVLAIYDGNKEIGEVASGYDSEFIYRVGETVEVLDFDTDRWNECAPGIHFFITRAEAEEY